MASGSRATLFPRLSINETHQPRPPKRSFLTGENIPPKLPIAVNSGSLFPALPQPKALILQNESPWLKYREILNEDQAGPCVIAHKNDSKFTAVVIKRRPMMHQSRNQITLVLVKHPNIISLEEAFISQDIYLIYEHLYVDVTLREIRASPSITFRDYELAAICKEVSFKGPLYSLTYKLPRF